MQTIDIPKLTPAEELERYMANELGEREQLDGPKGFPKGRSDYADARKRKRRNQKAARRRSRETRNGQHL